MRFTRRRFLAASAGLVAGACSSDGDDDSATSTDDSSTTPAATDPPATTTSTSTSTTSTTTTTTEPPATTTTEPAAVLPDDPFALGVASGDPDEGSVVLWTRLVGDLPDDGIDVAWTFVPDDGGETVTGSTRTDALLGGSVHAVAEIPGPGTFSFSAGGWDSPTGTTAPIDPTTTEYRIAAGSCQNYEGGWYVAHRDIAEWRPDLVAFLGDFIYEGGAGSNGVRSHEGPEVTDLDGYRARYATYLSDPDLQAARAAAPWLVIWDDHEVENDYAGVTPEGADGPSDEFADRRQGAYRAWWENTPTRLPPAEIDPSGPYPIHRGLDVGELVRISALDGRQYRDDQLSDAVLEPGPPVDGWDDPARTMLGEDQEQWIAERFTTSAAAWNCLAQQTVLGDVRVPGTGGILNYDQWDGYAAARDRLLADAPPNLVTITGDIHLAAIGLLGPPDARVGVEFVSTAISSTANVDPSNAGAFAAFENVVDVELVKRGYTRHTITPERWTAEYRQVDDVTDPDSAVVTWKTYTVESGSASVAEA